MKPAWPLIPALLALAVAGGCGEQEASVVVLAPPVDVAPVEAHRLVDRVEATGQLLAKAQATIAAQVGGQISEVRVEEGDALEEGQVVLEIDPERRELELDNHTALVTQAEVDLGEKEREKRNVESLRSRNAASQAQLDSAETARRLAKSRLVAARAQLELAARALRDSSVTAPFSGLVARRHVSAGEFVAPGQKLVDLVALDPVEVEFHLSEVDSSLVELGDRVEVTVAPYPGEIFTGTVTVIAPTIDPETRTLRVKAEIANPAGRLKPGLFARARLGVAERSGVAMIPEDAVLQRADGAVVFRLAGDERVERRRVETGIHRDGLVEVRKGVEVGDVVVVRGQAGLIDGSLVDLRNPDGSALEPSSVGAGPPASANALADRIEPADAAEQAPQ